MPQDLTHQFIAYSFKREITEFYVSLMIKNLGVAMISIFEVIYLYQFFGESVPLTLVFYGGLNLLYGLFVPFGVRLIERIGVKRSILVANPFLFGFYLALYFLPQAAGLIFLAFTLRLVYLFLFWPSFHIDFSRFSSEEKRGRQTSGIFAINLLTGAIGPILGGFIVAKIGFPTLFVVGMVLIVASAFPLFFSREVHDPYALSWRQAMGVVLSRHRWRTTLAHMAQGGENKIAGFVWPIFLFTLVSGFAAIGVISSAAIVVVLIAVVVLGRIVDRVDRAKFLRVGALLNSTGWAFRAFVNTDLSAFFGDLYARLTQRTAYIPFVTIFYEKAHSKGAELDSYIVYREMANNLGAAFIHALNIVLFLLTGQLAIAFLVAALLALGFMLASSASLAAGEPQRIHVSLWHRLRGQ